MPKIKEEKPKKEKSKKVSSKKKKEVEETSFDANAEEQKPKSKLLLIIGIILMVIGLSMGGAGGFLFFKKVRGKTGTSAPTKKMKYSTYGLIGSGILFLVIGIGLLVFFLVKKK